MRKIIMVAACCCVYSLCYGEEPAGNVPAEGGTPVVVAQQAAPADEGQKCDYLTEIFGSADACGKMTYHHLNYSILGAHDIKMQASFKYRLVEKKKLFLTVTARLFWGIYEQSNPLTDIEFNPELFYRFDGNKDGLISADAGFYHLSNGRDSTASRAWDQLFVRFNAHPVKEPFDLFWVTNVFATINKSDYNADIYRYSGFWDTKLLAHQLLGRSGENLDLEFKLTSGKNGVPFDRGSIQLGAKYKVPGGLNPYLYAEYFKGYAETILDYNKRSEELRAGIAFYY